MGKGVPARGQLYIDGKLVANVEMPHTVPILFGTEGLTCGYDGGDPVAPEEYDDAFRVHRHDPAGRHSTCPASLITDAEAELKVAMARQ